MLDSNNSISETSILIGVTFSLFDREAAPIAVNVFARKICETLQPIDDTGGVSLVYKDTYRIETVVNTNAESREPNE